MTRVPVSLHVEAGADAVIVHVVGGVVDALDLDDHAALDLADDLTRAVDARRRLEVAVDGLIALGAA